MWRASGAANGAHIRLGKVRLDIRDQLLYTRRGAIVDGYLARTFLCHGERHGATSASCAEDQYATTPVVDTVGFGRRHQPFAVEHLANQPPVCLDARDVDGANHLGVRTELGA